MPKRAAIAACLALSLGLLTGCGGGGGKPAKSEKVDTNSSTLPGGAAQTSGTPAAGNTVNAEMKNIQFVPKTLKVKVGQTIIWTNNDGVAHTVTAKSPQLFDSGTVAPNAKFSYKPTKAGTIDYVCTIHPNQTGTIEVSS